jgi:hypothetical protein
LLQGVTCIGDAYSFEEGALWGHASPVFWRAGACDTQPF